MSLILDRHPYRTHIRLLCGGLALFMLVGIFALMTALSKPSQYVSALRQVEKGPGKAGDLNQLGILNFNRHLYLSGPITSASGQNGTPLFAMGQTPVLAPSTFSDPSGAVELVAHELPLTAEPAQTYHYDEPLHFLGWRTSQATLTLFVMAKSRESLIRLLSNLSANWKFVLFYEGLILAGMVFSIFWLLNMALLSNISLRPVQLFIVNAIFLVLYYSVLVLSAYPLLSTLLATLGILLIANLVFVPLSFILHAQIGGQAQR